MGEFNVAHHSRVIVPGDVAGEFKLGMIGKFPDEVSRLARLQQDAVAFLVHAMSHGFLHHFGSFPIDAVRLEYTVLDHHFHFGGVRFVHRGGGDVEFVNELALVRDDESNGLPFLQIQRLRFKIVIEHLDRYGLGYVFHFTGLADLVHAMAIAVLALRMGRKRRRKQGDGDGNGSR